MMSEQDWQLVDRYLSLRMTPKEIHAFEKRLEEDVELRNALDSILDMEKKVDRFYGMKKWEDVGKSQQVRWPWFSLAASVLLFALGTYSWFVFRSQIELPSSKETAKVLGDTTASRITIPKNEFKELRAFHREPLILVPKPDSIDLVPSEEELILGASTGQLTSEERFKQGWKLLQDAKPQEAFFLFQSIQDAHHQDTREWWEALALIEWKGKAAGKKRMLKIVKNPSHLYYSQAKLWWSENFTSLPRVSYSSGDSL